MKLSLDNLIIRQFRESDSISVRDIYDRHYQDNEYPEFSKFGHTFVVTDINGKIISVAGIKHIPELVAVTDKEFSPQERKQALTLILGASRYFQDKFNAGEIFTFINNDDKWAKRLIKSGFNLVEDKVLVLRA